MPTLGEEMDDIRQELLIRMPNYGFFDGLVASVTVGFLNLIAPEQKRSEQEQRQKRHEQARQRSTISSRITNG